jgi:hypothetical protein
MSLLRTQPFTADGLASANSLRAACIALYQTPVELMAATTVVGVVGRDAGEIGTFRTLVQDLADEYGLDATLEINIGSFSVRFTRHDEKES